MSNRVGGDQRRGAFQCIVESVKQRFTLFSTTGIPLRATLTVTLREFRTLDEQLAQLNLNSPDKTNSHTLRRGETLSAVAERHYERAAHWRQVAEANNIDDPRRVPPGSMLQLPRIASKARL